MQYVGNFVSPLGNIFLAAEEEQLIGAWFEGQKYFARILEKEHEEKETDVFVQTKRWFDIYFSGKEPEFTVPIRFTGTEFQKEVWRILCTVPYGKTVSYADIATVLEKKRGMARMSAQAVGGAVGRNNISVIVPCHRVIGTNGSLTGYAGGTERKLELLKLENYTEKIAQRGPLRSLDIIRP